MWHQVTGATLAHVQQQDHLYGTVSQINIIYGTLADDDSLKEPSQDYAVDVMKHSSHIAGATFLSCWLCVGVALFCGRMTLLIQNKQLLTLFSVSQYLAVLTIWSFGMKTTFCIPKHSCHQFLFCLLNFKFWGSRCWWMHLDYEINLFLWSSMMHLGLMSSCTPPAPLYDVLELMFFS